MSRPRLRSDRSTGGVLDGPVTRRFLAGRPFVAIAVGTWHLVLWAVVSVALALVRFWVGLFPRVRARRVRSAIRTLPDDPTVLFLCPENRCLSPLAERFARAELDRRSITGVEVNSGSLVPVGDEDLPATARAAARRFSVDLADHDPRVVTRDELDRSDLVLVMDGRDYLRLAVFGTGALWKAYMLGSLSGRTDGYATDGLRPGASEGEYWRTFASVTEAVERLVDNLEDHGLGSDRSTPPSTSPAGSETPNG